MSRWAEQWLMTFDPSKTKAMLFSSSSCSRNDVPKLIFDNTLITFVDNHKHLEGSWVRYPVWQHTFVSPSAFSRRQLSVIGVSMCCTTQDLNSLEKLQNEAARLATGLTRSVSLEKLYKECAWAPLSERRQFQKLCFMYKCNYTIVPDYISDLIPPLEGEVSNYPLRNANDFTTPRTRTETFRKSVSLQLLPCGTA